MMLKVRFYDEVKDELLKFAVIFATYENQWIFCKHKDRTTYECPGGHREEGEDIDATAARELYEETGAVTYRIQPICIYSVQGFDGTTPNSDESFGKLYYAEVTKLATLPKEYEMERIELCTKLPTDWTYPEIQPILITKVMEEISGLSCGN